MGLGLLTVGVSRSYSDTHTHSVGLLWKRDRPFQRILIYNTQHKRQTSMPLGGIRTRNPSKRASAHRHLRPRGHWDRPKEVLVHDNICVRYLQKRDMHVGYKKRHQSKRDHVQTLGLHDPVSPTHKIATFLEPFALMGEWP